MQSLDRKNYSKSIENSISLYIQHESVKVSFVLAAPKYFTTQTNIDKDAHENLNRKTLLEKLKGFIFNLEIRNYQHMLIISNQL